MTRKTFLFYSRPLFRTCEILCNHAARVLASPKALATPAVREAIADLNRRRIDLQGVLDGIGQSHAQACADCKGKCCGGARERDAFIDRVLQDPDTQHLSARRKTGEMAAHKLLDSGRCLSSTCVLAAQSVEGYCPELTVQGCRIPYELRPIQCVAYFCNKAADQLSEDECRAGTSALAGLMGIQLRTVLLALKSRLK